MTISNFRSHEPLYMIMVRDNDCERWLRQWVQRSQNQVQFENNRAKVFEERSLTRFFMDWPFDWDRVTIWDCWNRRHIYKE